MAGPDKEMAAHELIAALFDVVVDEARRNRRFARRLLSVYPQSVVARIETAPAKPRGAGQPDLHAVNILRRHGEAMLRGRLSALRTKAELRAVARASGLRLTGAAMRRSASKAEIVDGIVEAARHYLAQRRQATRG